MNWDIPGRLYSRPFGTLEKENPLSRARTPAESVDALRMGGRARYNQKTPRRYGSRCATPAAEVTTGPRPWSPEGSWPGQSREAWLYVCIFFKLAIVLKHENGRIAWRYPEALVRVSPHLQFSAAGPKNEGRYYSNVRMAPLAYVAFASAVWETAYSLMNVAPNEASDRTLLDFVEEEPRVGPPPQRRTWCGFPDFFRPNRKDSKRSEETDALSAKKKTKRSL